MDVYRYVPPQIDRDKDSGACMLCPGTDPSVNALTRLWQGVYYVDSSLRRSRLVPGSSRSKSKKHPCLCRLVPDRVRIEFGFWFLVLLRHALREARS